VGAGEVRAGDVGVGEPGATDEDGAPSGTEGGDIAIVPEVGWELELDPGAQPLSNNAAISAAAGSGRHRVSMGGITIVCSRSPRSRMMAKLAVRQLGSVSDGGLP
jgi:hypothetical protein